MNRALGRTEWKLWFKASLCPQVVSVTRFLLPLCDLMEGTIMKLFKKDINQTCVQHTNRFNTTIIVIYLCLAQNPIIHWEVGHILYFEVQKVLTGQYWLKVLTYIGNGQSQVPSQWLRPY